MLPRLRAPMVAVTTFATAALVLGAAGPAAATSRASVDPRPAASAPSAAPAAGTFYPTAPLRVVGTAAGGSAVTPAAPASVTTAGRSGLPSSGVSALMVNVTVTAGAADVRLSFAPSGASAPGPLLAVPAAATRSTLLTVPLATTSGFDVSAAGGAATVTADVVGFYASDDTVVAGYGLSGGYQPVDPTRLTGPSAVTLAPGGRSLLAVDLGAAVTPHVTALLVSVSATGGPGGTGAPSAGSTPSAALAVSAPTAPAPGGVLPTTVSVAAGAPAGNLALVPAEVDSSGRLGVAVSAVGGTSATSGAGGTQVGYSLDLVGFYDDGAIGPNLRFRPLPQTRVLDAATGLGGLSTLTPGAGAVTSPGDAVVDDSTFALAGVLTTTAAAPTGVAALSPDGSVTDAAAVPVGPGTTSLAVQPELGVGRDLAVVLGAGPAPTGLTLDVVGSFEASPAVTNPGARGWVPPVSPWQISATVQSS